MSEKKYVTYLSFIYALIISILFNVVMLIGTNHFCQFQNFSDVLSILLWLLINFASVFLGSLILFIILRLICGKEIYTISDAMLNICIFRNIPKAIELCNVSLEQLGNRSSKSTFQERQIKDSTRICYWELMVCYAKLKENETAKECLEKYLEFFPEKDREKTKKYWYKIYQLDKILPEESYEKKIVKTGIKVLFITIIFSCLFCLFRSYFYPYPRITILAETDNIETANEIQELIGQDVDVIRIKDGATYQIGAYNTSTKTADKISLVLADSDLHYKDLSIIRSIVTENSNNKRIEKEAPKIYTRKISLLYPVLSSKVKITLGECPINKEECESGFADVEINAFQNADTENITRIVQNLLIATVPNLSKDNIKIKFNITNDCKNNTFKNCPSSYPISISHYYTLAKEYYEIGNFEKARQLLIEADKRTQNYQTSIESLDKIQKLNKAIENNPKDYKLYIQRGDLKNMPEFSMFFDKEYITSDYYGAIKDYEKALEHNPKAYNVYTKLASAYMECGYQKCSHCKLEKDKNDYVKAIEYYEKALKYSCKKGDIQESDYIYSQLGKIYALYLNNPQKAIEYYSKISDIYAEPELKTPYPDGFFKTTSNYPIKAISIANLYAQIGDYGKAIDLLDNTIIKSKSNDTIQEANNLKFLYLWKSKQYKKTLKQADNCSVWVCKLIGVVF